MRDYLQAWSRSFNFSGRARRREFWIFTLGNVFVFAIVVFATVVILDLLGAERPIPLKAIVYTTNGFPLLTLTPTIAVTVRRLHDTGRSGWLILSLLLPPIGTVVMLYFLMQNSEPRENEYGPCPKVRYSEMPCGYEDRSIRMW
ncbi:DUF805 domain-containing protein [Rubinisphaera brasiliensis]|uniref:DUF805 domain-containing protein n=1 Tax=Rubinisphaera brasiliensis (strain ATCC 49424 / DSM 5305 / JCM 21570 / IAM 15109 / NBRC 103401 / IFAM 1448) TaxID=756272 RepID=F0SKI9_RUBBR|nr:DUF805 domain-containing protein [Rubinisphaera brasiliensis]ADY61970.1 protein of unknown function DUF805 [Rubinisphaera brasiliensis DSM 5305]